MKQRWLQLDHGRAMCATVTGITPVACVEWGCCISQSDEARLSATLSSGAAAVCTAQTVDAAAVCGVYCTNW